LQTLDPIASKYPDLDFYVISYNEPVEEIAEYIEEHGYTDVIPAEPVGVMLEDLQVTRQMAMMAMNGNGMIYHRQVMGSAASWEPYFTELAADPVAVPEGVEIQRQKDQRQQDLQLPS